MAKINIKFLENDIDKDVNERSITYTDSKVHQVTIKGINNGIECLATDIDFYTQELVKWQAQKTDLEETLLQIKEELNIQ
jgi:hypothetical protein